ncbi:MAG: alkaline phosphatase family protein [Candidatus Spyradenecus sp.]
MNFSRRGFLKGSAMAAALAAAPALRAATGKMPPRVVMLSLDGIRTDGLQQAKTPNLDALFAEGSFSWTTRDVMPSITLPNWTSHLVGAGPEQHGVVENSWSPKKNRIPPTMVDDEGYYPLVFQVLKEQVPGIKTAFYWNWKPLINPYNQKHFDEAFYEENDAYAESYAKALDFMKANRNDPTLIFLYSVHTDHAGHRHKWMSPQYIASIEEADIAIGQLLEQMKAEGLFEGTHFLFMTDHGGVGNGHGGVSKAEMIVPWGIVGPGIKRGHTIEGVTDTINTAPTLCRLFGVTKLPPCWQGKVTTEVFL